MSGDPVPALPLKHVSAGLRDLEDLLSPWMSSTRAGAPASFAPS